MSDAWTIDCRELLAIRMAGEDVPERSRDLAHRFGLLHTTLHLAADDAGTNKTLVAWASPANLGQQGGSALTIQSGDRFDAIVFGERARGRWMAGSNYFRRTQADQGGYPAETADAAVAAAAGRLELERLAPQPRLLQRQLLTPQRGLLLGEGLGAGGPRTSWIAHRTTGFSCNCQLTYAIPRTWNTTRK